MITKDQNDNQPTLETINHAGILLHLPNKSQSMWALLGGKDMIFSFLNTYFEIYTTEHWNNESSKEDYLLALEWQNTLEWWIKKFLCFYM